MESKRNDRKDESFSSKNQNEGKPLNLCALLLLHDLGLSITGREPGKKKKTKKDWNQRFTDGLLMGSCVVTQTSISLGERDKKMRCLISISRLFGHSRERRMVR